MTIVKLMEVKRLRGMSILVMMKKKWLRKEMRRELRAMRRRKIIKWNVRMSKR